jgi:hypothetical protein
MSYPISIPFHSRAANILSVSKPQLIAAYSVPLLSSSPTTNLKPFSMESMRGGRGKSAGGCGNGSLDREGVGD